MNARAREESVTLEILRTIDDRSDVTQRHLAERLGVALGLANSYLKRCVRKGLIKIEQAPANRYLYYLTPTGFAEKSRLTAEYLSSSFDFYRRASASCGRVMAQCTALGYRSIVLCGVSELAEIASLRAREQGVTVIGFIDETFSDPLHLSLPVWRDLQALQGGEGLVLTDLRHPQQMLERIAAEVAPERILIPDILGIDPESHHQTGQEHAG